MTRHPFLNYQLPHYFNPHEREARDFEDGVNPNSDSNFNPHEREARDAM